MQILGLWKDRKAGAEKRKRASAEDFFDTEDRKRIKAAVDSPSRGSPENEAVPDAKEPLPSPSPLHTSTLRSPTDAPSSPPMRPDRRRNIRDSDAPPLDSLPTSPGHAPDDSTVPERSPASDPQHSASLDDPKSRASPAVSGDPRKLQIDTAISVDPRKQNHIHEMDHESAKGEIAPEAMSAKEDWPKRTSITSDGFATPKMVDSYRPDPPSRRPSQIKDPPPQGPRRTSMGTGRTPSWPKVPSNSTTSPTKVEASLQNASQSLSLVQDLCKFAESVASSAGLTARSDLAKQQAAVQGKELARQRRNQHAFATLVEDTETKTDAVKKTITIIDKQVATDLKDRTKAAENLASRIQTAQPATSNARLPNEGSIRKELGYLRDELAEAVKDERRTSYDLKDVRKDIKRLSEDAISQRRLEKKLTRFVSKEALVSVESAIAKTTVTQSKFQEQIEAAKGHSFDITQIRENLSKIEAKISRPDDSQDLMLLNRNLTTIEKQIANLEQGATVQKRDYDLLKTSSEVQSDTIEKLHISVQGNHGEERGLLELLAEDAEKIEKLQENLKVMQARIDEIHDNLGEKLVAAKSNVSGQVLEPAEDLSSLKETVATMGENLHALRFEQQGKDDVVSSALEELDTSCRKCVEDLACLKSDTTAYQSQQAQYLRSMRATMDQQQSQITTRPSHPPTPPLPNGALSPYDPSGKKLQQLDTDTRQNKDKVDALEVLVKAQQQKFDGLTSDHVVQHMVHEMQRLNPISPYHLNARMNQVQTIDNYLTTNLRPRLMEMDTAIGLRASTEVVENLEKRVQDSELRLEKTALDSVSKLNEAQEVLGSMLKNELGKSSNDMSNLVETVNNIQEDIKLFKSRLSGANQTLVKETRDAFENIGFLISDVDRLNRRFFSEISKEAWGNEKAKAELLGDIHYRQGIEAMAWPSRDAKQAPEVALGASQGIKTLAETRKDIHSPKGSTPSSRLHSPSRASAMESPANGGSRSNTPSSTRHQPLRKRKRRSPPRRQIIVDDSDDEDYVDGVESRNEKASKRGD